jgi:pyridoxal phosphate enzyme (YggS family)
MINVKENIRKLQDSLPKGVGLVAVSKFHPVELLREAYDAGQRIFGESRAQELLQKVGQMPDDVKWHFIGHLQTNKVRAIVPYVAMIHSIDSEKLLRVVDSEAERAGRVVDVLLQLHVAQEETKYGMTADECVAMVESGVLAELTHVRVCGVMGMATNTDDENEIRAEFRKIKQVFDLLHEGCLHDSDCFREISMGMSDDYQIAVEEGSTLVRVGHSIFGERQY